MKETAKDAKEDADDTVQDIIIDAKSSAADMKNKPSKKGHKKQNLEEAKKTVTAAADLKEAGKAADDAKNSESRNKRS